MKTEDDFSIDQLNWNEQGLIPVVAQDAESATMLMLAWMNKEALELTLQEGIAVYWSRSRQKLWRKGESSGHRQILKELRIDCDRDSILIKVEQLGGIACHTGRQSCFYYRFEDSKWVIAEAVIKPPEEIYTK